MKQNNAVQSASFNTSACVRVPSVRRSKRNNGAAVKEADFMCEAYSWRRTDDAEEQARHSRSSQVESSGRQLSVAASYKAAKQEFADDDDDNSSAFCHAIPWRFTHKSTSSSDKSPLGQIAHSDGTPPGQVPSRISPPLLTAFFSTWIRYYNIVHLFF